MLGNDHIGMNVIHAMTLGVTGNQVVVSLVVILDNFAAFLDRALGGEAVEKDTFVPAAYGRNVFAGESPCSAKDWA